MFSDLKPYECYGAAPGQWIPKMPEHWRVTPGSNVLKPVAVKNTGLVESTVLSLSYGRVIVKAPGKLRGLVPDSFETYQILEPGDIVVRPTDLQNDKTSLRVGHVRDRGIITSAYLGLRANGVSDTYAFTYLAALDHMKIFYGMGSGLRQNLDLKDFKRLPVPVPPVSEQAAIVKYLGHAYARIDRAIAAKRKLTSLLEERKRAIIQQAVTRGLDSSVPLKDSGILWLGEIPAHWRVSRVAREFDLLDHRRKPLASEIRGQMTAQTYDYYGASGVIDKVEDYLFDEATILIAEDGANLVLRNLPLAIKADGKYWVNNHAHILRPRDGDIDFLMAMLEGLDYRPWISGAAQPKLTQERLRSIAIAVPARDEQVRITGALRERIYSEIRTIGIARSEVDLLREFRTRLTSDVVTGQVDVREIAATLPELTGEVLASPDDEFGDDDELIEPDLEFAGANE